MGLFNRKKKIVPEISIEWKDETDYTYSSNEPFPEVEEILPWGWVAHNQEFIEPLENKRKELLHTWTNQPNNTTAYCDSLELYLAYLHDEKKLCEKKGGLFLKWFENYVANESYFERWETELKNLKNNYTVMREREVALTELSQSLFSFLQNHNGILQKDVYGSFQPFLKNDIQELLYQWEREGVIQRVKVGNSHKIII